MINVKQNRPMPKHILVTGATSFIGQALCWHLLRNGERLTALVRRDSVLPTFFSNQTAARVLKCGIEDCASALKGAGPFDAAVHLAWGGQGAAGRADSIRQQLNLQQSLALVDILANVGCGIFVGGGSQAEYGNLNGTITEDAICRPLTPYGEAKMRFTVEGASLCSSRGIKWRMPRIFSVYGAGDHPWALIPSLVASLKAKRAFPLTRGTQMWNYIHVDDAVRALTALLSPNCEDGIYNIASGTSRPLADYVRQIYARFPDAPPPLFGNIPDPAGGLLSLEPSIAKLMRETGWTENITFSIGIEELIAKHRETHELES